MSVLDQFKLDGQVVVVTGGGRGIGEAIALGMAEAGADIVVARGDDVADRIREDFPDGVDGLADGAQRAEETERILRWLESPRIRLVDVTGTWACPVDGAGRAVEGLVRAADFPDS